MQFARPMPFQEALSKLGAKSIVSSTLNSAEWSAVPLDMRERAFFSSTVESARFLQRLRDFIDDFLANSRDENGALIAGGRAQFVKELSEFAIQEGLGPLDPDDAGTIKDVTSQARLSLIFNTQVQQVHAFGYWKQGLDPDILDEFPAMRFIRVQDVKEPRHAHAIYEDAVALKSDLTFWTRINQDFGVPWGPWGWGCGHDVEDVDRAEAEQLGLIKPGEKPEPPELGLNHRLEASTRGLAPDLLDMLKESFGDQVEFQGDSARWKLAEQGT